MTFLRLSDVVRRLRGRWDREEMDVRAAAGLLAGRTYGADVVMQTPELINAAALSIAFGPRLVAHEIAAGAARRVHETDLHALPGEAPAFLRRAWLLESKRPERGEALFADVVGLAGYPLDGVIYLVATRYPDGVMVVPWRPAWGGPDPIAGELADGALISDVGAYREAGREAARFAVVLALLLEAESSPLRDEVHGERRGASRDGDGDVLRRITLGAVAARGAPQGGPGVEADLSGRVASIVPVRGFLRRQPHGPRGSLRKWIYVEGFEARRWVAPRDVRVSVN